MPTTVYDLDVKVGASDLKSFENEILQARLPNLGIDCGFGMYCCKMDNFGHLPLMNRASASGISCATASAWDGEPVEGEP
jgi:hypothetical protein